LRAAAAARSIARASSLSSSNGMPEIARISNGVEFGSGWPAATGVADSVQFVVAEAARSALARQRLRGGDGADLLGVDVDALVLVPQFEVSHGLRGCTDPLEVSSLGLLVRLPFAEEIRRSAVEQDVREVVAERLLIVATHGRHIEPPGRGEWRLGPRS